MKTLGVMGGMGPTATVAFLHRLQVLTRATREEEHIRVIADIHPRVPNRHSHPAEAGEELARMAVRLKGAGAAILAMPCNTAHAHADRIREAGLPFIDMIAATAAAARTAGARRVGMLCTPGSETLYREALTPLGVEMLTLEGEDRAAFMAAVLAVKGGPDAAASARMRGLAANLVAAGADHLIGGCTEVPLLIGQEDVSVPLTDSVEVLAAACVAACT